MSNLDHLQDSSLVTAIADLVHPESRTYKIFDEEVLVIGKERYDYLNPDAKAPVTLGVSTLQSIADFYAVAIANVPDNSPVIVQVASPTEVSIKAPLVGDRRQQFVYIKAVPTLPKIYFEQYLNMEQFLIQLQSAFVDTDVRKALQSQIAKLKTGVVGEIEDNGISQNVTTRAGITRTEEGTVQSTWPLHPFRTFTEIAPPASLFLLRLKQEKRGDNLVAEAALFEADGGAWRTQAISDIGAWLRSALGKDAIILS